MAETKKGKAAKAASFEPGFHFGFDHGGSTTLLAVNAPIDRASPAVAKGFRLVVRPDVYGRSLDEDRGILGWQYAVSPYTLYLLGSYLDPETVVDLSRKLDTVVACYVYEKHSDWQGFRVYDRGVKVETYDWGLDYSGEIAEYAEEMGEKAPTAEPTDENGKPFDHRVVVRRPLDDDEEDDMALEYEYRFRSERRTVPAELVTDEKRMLQSACEFYGLLMPGDDLIPASGKKLVAKRAKKEHFTRVDVLSPPGKGDMAAADAQLKAALKALDVEGVKEAVVAGANLKEVAGSAMTPIAYAVAVGKREPQKAAEVVRVLAAAGVSPNATAAKDADPPLLDLFDGFSSARVIPLAEALLDAGADVNAVGRNLTMKGCTALHGAATSSSAANVLFLLARGADPRATHLKGKTPRQDAEGLAGMYESGGMYRGDIWLPPLRRIIEHLKAAEAGAPPADWRAAYEQEVPEAEPRARQVSEAFAEFGKAMEAFGKEIKAEESSAKKEAVKQAIAAQPDRFDVRRDDAARWPNPSRRDKSIAALESHGYQRVGPFTVEQVPNLRLFLLHHPAEHVYAAVCEQFSQHWVDLVRYHADGSTVTVSNAAVDPDAKVDRPHHPKLREKRWGVNKLVDLMRAQPTPQGVLPVRPEEFPQRLSQFLREEVAWLRARKQET